MNFIGSSIQVGNPGRLLFLVEFEIKNCFEFTVSVIVHLTQESGQSFKDKISLFSIDLDAKTKCSLYKGYSYVDDFMILTILRCWWQNHYVGDVFSVTFSVTNITNGSQTQTVSEIRHQHCQCYIDVALYKKQNIFAFSKLLK